MIRIDLRELPGFLMPLIREDLDGFSTQHPDTPICTVGLWGDGYHGLVGLHLDTPDRRDAYVQEWLRRGPGEAPENNPGMNRDGGPLWPAEDRHGYFSSRCFDFTHDLAEYILPYPLLWKEDMHVPVEYITLDGARVTVGAEQGDGGKDYALAPLLKYVLTQLQPFPGLTRASPFRVGVQMKRWWPTEFWALDVGSGGS